GTRDICLTSRRAATAAAGQSADGLGARAPACSPAKENAMTKRLLIFAYGLASYLVFLATFLSAIAFVGGCPAVPSRLDGPLRTSLPLALAVDGALLTVF